MAAARADVINEDEYVRATHVLLLALADAVCFGSGLVFFRTQIFRDYEVRAAPCLAARNTAWLAWRAQRIGPLGMRH